MKPIFLDSDGEVCSRSYSRSQPSTINNTEAKFFSIALDIVIKMLQYLKYAFKQCIVLQTWFEVGQLSKMDKQQSITLAWQKARLAC